MKQKVRALEEAVKQAIKCREDVETEYAVLEAARVEQQAELADASRRFEEASVRAEEWRTRREKAEEEAGSKLQVARVELVAVEARLEKLRAKRERLEGRSGTEEGDEEEDEGEEETGESPRRREGDALGGLVGELEAKLREILLERERIEADPYAQLIPSNSNESPIASTAADKPSMVADTRTQGQATIHGRNASYSHARSKRLRRRLRRPGTNRTPLAVLALGRDRSRGENRRPRPIHKRKNLHFPLVRDLLNLHPSKARIIRAEEPISP